MPAEQRRRMTVQFESIQSYPVLEFKNSVYSDEGNQLTIHTRVYCIMCMRMCDVRVCVWDQVYHH